MSSKAYVRPSKAASIVTVIMAAFFLVFGIVLCGTAEGEARPYVLMFMIIWIVACVAMIVYGLSVIFSKSPPPLTEVEIPTSFLGSEVSGVRQGLENGKSGSGMDFETKLIKLENLKNKRLISEKEYAQKRTEIMEEKW